MAALLGRRARGRARSSPRKPREGEVCQLANDNGAGQVVISGAQGRRRARHRARQGRTAPSARMLLPVSAPFHCALMQPAADAMAEALATATRQRAGRAADRQRHGRADQRSRRDQQPPGRAGHRPVRWRESVACHGRARASTDVCRVRRRQGAVRAGQAHRRRECRRQRRRRRHDDRRRAARCSQLEGNEPDVRSDRQDGARHRRDSGGIGGAIARALARQGATVALSGHARRGAGGAGGRARRARVHVLPCDLATGPQMARRSVRSREAELGRARHPGQQCRHHQRQPVHAHEGRGLGRRDRGQSHRHVPRSRAPRCAA